MIRRLFIIVGFGAALFTAFPTFAQITCGKHSDLINGLKVRYSEQPVGMGLTAESHLVEVYSSENGTWTILVTRPGGISCLVAARENWEHIQIAAPSLGLAV